MEKEVDAQRLENDLDFDSSAKQLEIEKQKLQQNEQYVAGDLNHQLQLEKLASLQAISEHHSRVMAEVQKNTTTTIIGGGDATKDILKKHVQAAGVTEFIKVLAASLFKDKDVLQGIKAMSDFGEKFNQNHKSEPSGQQDKPGAGWRNED